MARVLESIFVFGCSLVGLALNSADGRLNDTVQSSVQLVALTHAHVLYQASHAIQAVLAVSHRF